MADARSEAPDLSRWYEPDRWWVIALAGVAAISLSFVPGRLSASAEDVSRVAAALLLGVLSIDQIVQGFRDRSRPVADLALVRGGIGALASLPALLAAVVPAIRADGAWQTLELGLIAWGATGVVGLGAAIRRWGSAPDLRAAWAFAAVASLLGGALLTGVMPKDVVNKGDWGSPLFLLGLMTLWHAHSRRRSNRSPGQDAGQDRLPRTGLPRLSVKRCWRGGCGESSSE